jgi:hypothetical protein
LSRKPPIPSLSLPAIMKSRKPYNDFNGI